MDLFNFTEAEKVHILDIWEQKTGVEYHPKTPYEFECLRILEEIPQENIDKVFKWQYCDIEFDFLGFLESYADLPDYIPKGTTVLDFGCAYGIQSVYFKDFNYIGIDNGVPSEYRLEGTNATYIDSSIQDFIKNNPFNLDFNKCIAICSYVPDQEAEKMVIDNFKYARVVYCNEIKKDTVREFMKGKEIAYGKESDYEH